LSFLNKEGVATQYIPRKPGARTGAVVLGIEPPDKFPLVFYRDNAADIQLTIDDVLAAPLADTRVFEFAGTNLSREPVRSATLFAAEIARQAGATIVLDLDFRLDQWHDPRAFGAAIRSALRGVDLIIGTEDEIKAALLSDPSQVQVAHSQMSDAHVPGDSAPAIAALLAYGPQVLIEKRGPLGARVHLASGEQHDVPGFTVPVYNVVGAGDAFAAGCLYGYIRGWDWPKAVRLGNACGAIVVTRHGCASAMAYEAEALQFIAAHGGF